MKTSVERGGEEKEKKESDETMRECGSQEFKMERGGVKSEKKMMRRE